MNTEKSTEVVKCISEDEWKRCGLLPSWNDLVMPALDEMGPVVINLSMLGAQLVMIYLGIFIKSVYSLGYREGARQRNPLTFVCPEEETDERT